MIRVGALFLLAWLLLLAFGAGAMPSYFAAWLFWFGVPAGALTIVLAADAFGLAAPGGRTHALLPILRGMLLLLPAASLFAIPWLLGAGTLFPASGKLPAWWLATLVPRQVVILVLLALLAFLARIPRGSAPFLLAATVVLLSLAAVDWLAAPQPALVSSAAGPLLIAGQMALAATLAAFLLAIRTEASARLPFGVGLLLCLLLAFWALVHFEQFLVVWSANLPDEATWYLARGGGLGTATLAFAATVAAIAIAFLPSGIGRVPALLATLLAPVLLALLLTGLWLVTPAYRGAFSLSLADLAAAVGLGTLLLGLQARRGAIP